MKPSAAQAPQSWGPAPSLTKVDPFVAARTHVGLPSERGHAGGWGVGLGQGLQPPTPTHTRALAVPSLPLLGPLVGPLAFRSSARATGTSMGPVT